MGFSTPVADTRVSYDSPTTGQTRRQGCFSQTRFSEADLACELKLQLEAFVADVFYLLNPEQLRLT